MIEHVSPTGSDHPDRPVHLVRYDSSGLTGRRLRLMTDLPTSDAGHLQAALLGKTEVISLDDTPNAIHNLRVRPLDSDAVAIVCIDQLAYADETH